MAENINQNTGKDVHILYAAVFEVLGLEEGEMAGRSPAFYPFGKSTLALITRGEPSLYQLSPAQSGPLHLFFGGRHSAKTTPVN